jgi:cation diffusion facilitator family transporter
MSAQADSMKSVLYALGANFGIAIAKSVAAVITKSGSMMAEAIHSFADCGNQALLLWGMKSAKRKADEDHPLGYGKAIYFWSFVVAVLLFSVGGLFSVYEGWHKLHGTEPLNQPWIALGVLAFGVALESISMRTCMREVNKIRGDRSWFRWFRESRQAELVVIFGEDLAALLGLTFAFFAVLATMVTGNPVYDAAGSIAIGVLLIIVAFFVAIEVKALLVGQSAEAPVREAIEAYIGMALSVEEVLHVITLHFGDDVMVAVKARFKETHSVGQLAAEINALEQAMKEEFPQVKWIFFEPDTVR